MSLNLPSLTFPPSASLLAHLHLVSITNKLPPIYESFFNIYHALNTPLQHTQKHLLSAAITRFCNSFLSDQNAENKKIELKQQAKVRGISPIVIDIRNQFAHGQISHLPAVKFAAQNILFYIQKQYNNQHLIKNPCIIIQQKLTNFQLEQTNETADAIVLFFTQNDLTNTQIRTIFSRFFYSFPALSLKIANSSDNFLSNSPFSNLKRLVQTLNQRVQLPIFSFILGQKVDFSGVKSDVKQEFLLKEMQEIVDLEIIGGEEFRGGVTGSEMTFQEVDVTEVLQRWHFGVV